MEVDPLGQTIKKVINILTKKNTNNDGKQDDDTVFDIEEAVLLIKEATKQAKVQGYDDNNLIYRKLNSVSNDISKNNIENALKKLVNIKGIVFPFDFDEFFKIFEETKKTANQLNGKSCWVLLGPTGAGKSTSIHYLCGSEFEINKKMDGIVKVTKINEPKLKYKKIKIGTNLTESETRHIDEIYLDLAKLGMNLGKNEPKEVLLVDSPGFEDIARPEVNISNSIGTIRALKNAKKVKIIVTFKAAHLDCKFQIMRNIATSLGNVINDLETMLNNVKSPIVGFLTKSTSDVDEMKNVIKSGYDEREMKTNENEETYFKSLLYKLDKLGPLYRININEDPSKNKEERIKITKNIVSNSTYITAPDEVFKEFISESSLNKLKDQIDIEYRTIENILNNDEYFSNPIYIEYIINILKKLEKLNDIIKDAGGDVIKTMLKACKDILKTKWNEKIKNVNNILSDTNNVNKKFFAKKLNEFSKISQTIIKCSKILKTYEKCWDGLKDVNVLDGLNKCFDNEYNIIKSNIDNINEQINSKLNDNDDNKVDNNNNNNNDNSSNNFEMTKDISNKVLLSIQKCCIVYNKYKDTNPNVVKKFKKMKLQLSNMIEILCDNCKDFMKKSNSKTDDGITKFVFMFTKISQVHSLLYNINTNLEGTNQFDKKINITKSKFLINIDNTIKQFKSIIQKNINTLCKYFNLNGLNVIDNDTHSTTKGETKSSKHSRCESSFIVNKTKITTDEQLKTREVKLVNFIKWLNKFNDTLSQINTYDVNIFSDLTIWLNTVEIKFINLLSESCLDVLQVCNEFLLNQGPEKWNIVESLLKECDSLRQVNQVSINTSQDYFSTLSEYNYIKNKLSNEATDLIKKINDKETFDREKVMARLSIIIDATSSMCLNGCKTVISATIPKLLKFLKDNGITSNAFEIQVIGYRNYNAPSDKILEYSEFTYDVNILTSFVHSLKASYGWGNEAIEIAFNQLNVQKKKPNVILLMADAPANTLSDIKYKRDNKYKESYWQKEKGGRFKIIKTWEDELNEFMNASNNATVHCFYLNNKAKDNFEKITKIGKGKCKYLNIDNEKESIDLLQNALCDEILLKNNNNRRNTKQI